MEGGLREVAHEFGGRIPHGGGNRDSGGVGMGWVDIVVLLFLWLTVLVRVHSDRTLTLYLRVHTRSYTGSYKTQTFP